MIRPAASLALAALLLASACDSSPQEASAPSEAPVGTEPAPTVTEPVQSAGRPAQVDDFPDLQSRDCATVARFYADALAARQFDRAALVWNDPLIDSVRLTTLFTGYSAPRIAAEEPVTEGAAGSLYCTVPGTLTDGGNLARPPEHGELVLRRVNDVPGATSDQLRWTLRSSTFIEPLERP
ncbi:MAG TPA: hypothetical protein VNR60_01105 [Croceibacterium sp.]|nr:hypothetical protein [Croceibacterium sp.]